MACSLQIRELASPIQRPAPTALTNRRDFQTSQLQAESCVKRLRLEPALELTAWEISSLLQCLPSNATSTRASLKHAPPATSVRLSGTSALDVEPL